jgi:signal transduction histidine kinase
LILILLWALYQARLKQIAHQFNIRMEERVGERTRIARELHDTLLQSFHGLMLRFQAVQNMLPQRPVEAGRALETAIDRAAQAITEGRDAVQELRSSSITCNDLLQSLTALGEELTANQAGIDAGAPPVYRVLVEGTPRPIHPILRDDLYRIAREAVGNAFHHARATRIEVEIRFAAKMLRLRVRDDGIGMDPGILAHGGREGHWGLPGMRERVKSIGAQLEVWSQLKVGTEVEVTIPGPIAYKRSPVLAKPGDFVDKKGHGS